MVKQQTPDSQEANEFDLKHRITGAAVLLFLGALVLPWLLGPPSEASKIDDGISSASSTELLAEIEPINLNGQGGPNEIEVPETVYISKITPLDAQRDKQLVAAANKAADKKTGDDDDSNKGEAKEVADKASAAAKLESSKVDKERKKQQAKVAEANKAADAEKAAVQKKQVELARAKKDKERREKEQREKQLQSAIAAENGDDRSNNSSVEVGWVVQVGLFTEKSRALALISELRNSGFTASNSVVDTNRGPKTGTRVWLGPFAKRSAAQSEQKRLKSKAGKDGFIRVYP